jgi:RHS repeat-associated protein
VLLPDEAERGAGRSRSRRCLSARTASWLYCFDAAGNLTARSGQSSTCPAGNRFTCNDASQLTARNGDSSGWSHDKAGHETSAVAASTVTRTKEQWNAFSQLTELTVNGTRYAAEYTGTTGAERTEFGGTAFHHGPLGLAAQTTGGQDTGFVREPSGALNSMRTGGKSHYYLTDALGSVMGLVDASGARTHTCDYGPTGLPRTTPAETVPQPYRFAGTYLDPTGLYKMSARYYDPHLGRFTQPGPSGRQANPRLRAADYPVNDIDAEGLFLKSVVVLLLGGAPAGQAWGCLRPFPSGRPWAWGWSATAGRGPTEPAEAEDGSPYGCLEGARDL